MRHGQTVWNTERRFQGSLDSPLTALGVRQAEAYGRALAGELADPTGVRIVASPLPRAWQTAVLAATAMGADPASIELDARLREQSAGVWEGLTVDEVNRDHAEAYAARLADRWNIAAPNGESYRDVAERAGDWLADQTETDIPTLVVSHGVTGRVLRGLYAGLPRDELLSQGEPQDRIFKLSRGGIEEILA